MSEQNNTETKNEKKKGPVTLGGPLWDSSRVQQETPSGEPVDPGQVQDLQRQVDSLKAQLAALHAGEWGRDALQQKVAALEAQLKEQAEPRPAPQHVSLWDPVPPAPSMMRGRTRK